MRMLLALSCLLVAACIQFEDAPGSDETPTPTPSPTPGVVFFDTFETTAADWSMVDVSQTSGGLTGTASGSIGGGSLVQTATGAVGRPWGSGPSGIFETTLLRRVPLTPGDYSIQVTHQAGPGGSAISRNWLVVNGLRYELLAQPLEQRTIAITLTTSASLEVLFQTVSGDDMGLLVSADLEVTEIAISRDE